MARSWTEIEPADATEVRDGRLPDGTVLELPLNELGEPCPWPWEPQQLAGAPLGQYHCPYCGAMVIAGVKHIDYRGSAGSDD